LSKFFILQKKKFFGIILVKLGSRQAVRHGTLEAKREESKNPTEKEISDEKKEK